MRRAALLAAAGALVLLSNALLLGVAARNRRGGGEAVELTERELRLVPGETEGAWASLRLEWNADVELRRRDAGWFDRAKLGALGFETRLPPTDPEAEAYYGWQPPKERWVVLELDGESTRRWLERRRREFDAALAAPGLDPRGPEARRAVAAHEADVSTRSRLFPVDAGADEAALRARYPDPARWLLARAVVAASCGRPWDPATRSPGAPVVRGLVRSLRVEGIEVPREKRGLLDELARRDRAERERGRAQGRGDEPRVRTGEPRYRVFLRYGREHAPWVEEVRPLPASP